MPLPRIAVLCAISELGGAEISLLELVARLRDCYEFHLILPGEGSLKTRAELAGAKTWILPWPEALAGSGETSSLPSPAQIIRSAISLKPFTRRLAQLLEEIDPSAFVTNAVKAHIVGALTRRPKHEPLIWYMRDGLEGRPLSRKLLALLSNRCDLALCISRYVESDVRRYVSSSIPTSVVYNIVDFDLFRPGVSEPADLAKGPKDIWYGTVGAITPLKGLDIFLDAAEMVQQEISNAAFFIVGVNPYATQSGSEYESQLRRRVENSKLRNRVKFLGFRNDVPNVLSQLDALIQSNRGPEGLGRSVLEAMACGVPVVAVNKWGPAELIQDGYTGLLFPPLDARSLADRMLALGRDSSLRTRLAGGAHSWIQQNFAPSFLASQFEKIVTDSIALRAKETVPA
jgi:glycosyltransferase involved in cell wall biosynthesis